MLITDFRQHYTFPNPSADFFWSPALLFKHHVLFSGREPKSIYQSFILH